MYELTRDGLTFLVMGFTGPQAARTKEAYIQRFNAMEAALQSEPHGLPVPKVVEVVPTLTVPAEDYWRMRAELAEMRLERRSRKNADSTEEEMIIAMVLDGLGPTEIGRKTNRTASGVDSVIRRLRGEGRL